MKVLVACEFSGIVRDAFLARGHDAWSCDLEPTESDSSRHIQGDALREIQPRRWDLVIAHPPCTRLTNAGVRWLHERNLWEDLDAACAFFRKFLALDTRVAVENPIPHKYAVQRIGRTYDQCLQPWQFGHGETKAVCLWLKGLPPLKPTEIVSGRTARVHRMAPGPNRARERSRFFPGIAAAMAEQWSC